MADFVTLTCPSCGGKLQITQDIDQFACGYCGNEHMVKRGGGIVALAPLVEGLTRVQAGVDKTAAELAMPRLSREIADLNTRRDRNARIARDLAAQAKPIPTWAEEILATANARIAAIDRELADKMAELERHRQTLGLSKGTLPS